MLDRKMVINELRKRGYIAEEKNVVKNGVICDGISIHLPETKMENEKVQSVFGVKRFSKERQRSFTENHNRFSENGI